MAHFDLIAEKMEKKESGKKDIQPFTALLFLMTGVYGGLLSLGSVPGIVYSGWAACLISAAVCAMLWFSYWYRRKLFFFLAAGVAAISCIYAFIMQDVLVGQLARIRESISGKTAPDVMPVTEAAVLAAIGISMILFMLEIILQSHEVLYAFTTWILLIGPLIGMRPGIGTVVLFVFFQAAFWTLHLPKRGTGSRMLRGKSMRVTAAVLAVSLVTAFLLVSFYARDLYGLVYEAEGYAFRASSRLSGRAGAPITGGRIHGGNNYRTGTGHLELTLSGQPTETLYLRGFGGGEYIGGDWIRSSDEALFPMMVAKLGWRWQEWEYNISTMYYNMYFLMNSSMLRDRADSPVPLSLTVRHLNGEYGNAYVPYYSQRDRSWYGYGEDGTSREGYVYQYFEQPDMDIKWDNVAEDFEQMRDRYKELQAAYMEEIQEAYTQVPTEILPRLTALVEENPMNGLDEISAFILYTLHSNASYTLTPGWAPLNEDIAEYFLFESGRGYCEHFALTATLLYRLYGIPARYATGYMVQPSAFEQQEDGAWQAVATDENAHAWVEIFLEDYGWTPVEVTPAADGSTVARYPGFDRLELNRQLTEKNWDMDIPSLSQAGFPSVPEGNVAGSGQDFGFEWEIDFGKYEKLWWIAGTVLAYSLLLLPFFLDYRRLRRLKKTGVMNCRRVFGRFMEMLYFAGYFRGYDGSEEDFASLFAAEIPVVSLEEIVRFQNIVCEAAYGGKAPAAEQEALVREIYFRTGSYVYGRLKWRQKLIFRYFCGFG